MMKLPVSMDALRSLCAELPEGSTTAAQSAAHRQAMLTKPRGSLGRLEELAVFLARWQRGIRPSLDRVDVLIFAGSHGIAARGVSAYPTEVTAQMVANFANGGAAINQLAAIAGANLSVTPLEIDKPTADFTVAPAMNEAEFLAAVTAGMRAVVPGVDLITVGEMGIGNTTVASATAAALFGGSGSSWVGRGTGVDDEGLMRKATAVDTALAFHGNALQDPLEALSLVGGRELAAIFGAVLAARLQGVPVVLDGFVATAAAAPLARLHPNGLAHALAGHVSAEAQHPRLLKVLNLDPILDLGMRLGEGSGACLAVNILRSAIACHNGMASFAEAGVSEN